MRTKKTMHGKSMPKSELDPFKVGLMRFAEIGLSYRNAGFSKADVEYVGQCSIRRIKIIIGKDAEEWFIVVGKNYSKALLGHLKFIPHFIITGKRIVKLNVSVKQNVNEGRSKPLWAMTTSEIFHAGCGEACPKHQGRGNRHSDIGKYV